MYLQKSVVAADTMLSILACPRQKIERESRELVDHIRRTVRQYIRILGNRV